MLPKDTVGVVLAGGEGRRFGGDKLAAMVDGEAAVARAAKSLREAGAAEVYAATRSMRRCRLYTALAGFDGCVYDPPLACSGPGAAVLAAAEAAYERGWRRVLLVPGDAPWLDAVALARLVALAGGVDAATVIHGGGFLESLLQLHRGDYLSSLIEPLRGLCGLRGELRASDSLRLAPRLALVGSALLSYAATTYAHINTREALATREARNPLGEDLVVLGPERPRPLPWLPSGRVCASLAREEALYRRLGLVHLARQAARDVEKLCRRGDE